MHVHYEDTSISQTGPQQQIDISEICHVGISYCTPMSVVLPCVLFHLYCVHYITKQYIILLYTCVLFHLYCVHYITYIG